MHILITPDDDGGAHLSRLDDSGVAIGSPWKVSAEDLPQEVVSLELEEEQPRWVWDTVHDFYPRLLAAGVRLARCHDISLIRTILRFSSLVQDPRYSDMAARITGRVFFCRIRSLLRVRDLSIGEELKATSRSCVSFSS